MEAIAAWSGVVAAVFLLIGAGCFCYRVGRSKAKLLATVSSLKNVEERLGEHQQRFQLVFQLHPECVKIHTETGEIKEINTAGLAMFGMPNACEIIGVSVYDYIAPESIDGYRQVVAKVFRGVSCSARIRYIGFGGVVRRLETRLYPVRNSEGHVVAAMTLTRDVSKVLDTEDREQVLSTEMARMARIASIGETASGIAHELNQPLTAIANYAAAGLRMIETSNVACKEISDLLAEISLQARRAGQIVKAARSLVKRDEMRPAPVDINEVVRMMVRFAEMDAKRAGVTVLTKLDESVSFVRARKVEIEQVVFNLLRNSIEAVQHATASRRLVVASTVILRGGIVEVSVRDYGPGIPAEEMDRVFEPFYTTKTEGMGLGLAISRSIIEGHGSRLIVHSNFDGGVTFAFHFPVAMHQLKVAA